MMMLETSATSNETNSSANSIASDQANLLWSLSQAATAFNFSVELYMFLALVFYERRTGRFKGKLNDPIVVGKIITILCPFFAMLNLLATEAMIIADKLLTQHRNGDIICRVIYDVRPLTYSLAVLATYSFLWYRMLNLYKVDTFFGMNTRCVRVLKIAIPCGSFLCAVVGTSVFAANNVHQMTRVGCQNSNKSFDNFVDSSTLTAQIIASVLYIGLILYPLLSHKGTFSEEQDAVTRKLVRKATKVSTVSLAVTLLVDSAIFVVIWFYPTDWAMLFTYVLFDFSVLVKNLSVLFFFHEPFEMLFGWWRKSGCMHTC